MAFRLDLSANLGEEAARIEEQELRTADVILEAGDDEAIHDSRKHIKKLRALAELLRPARSGSEHRRRSVELRDAGRALSAVRDRAARIEALDRVAAELAKDDAPLPAAALDALRGVLSDHGDVEPARAIDTARQALRRLRAAHSSERLELDRETLVEGFIGTYARARQRFRALAPGADAERFHDLRKQVKYQQHQYALLDELWRPVFSALRDASDELGELLGHHHDLVILEEALGQLENGRSSEFAAVHRALPALRARKEERALALAAPFYVEGKRALERRIARYLELRGSDP